MKKLIINGHEFALPKNRMEQDEELNSTHIIFAFDGECESFIDGITEALGIKRFSHNLGIVFGCSQIFWNGLTPPKGIEVL
jgi:hypothetical protein